MNDHQDNKYGRWFRRCDSTYQQAQVGWDSGLVSSMHGHQEHIAWAGGFVQNHCPLSATWA